MSLDNYEYISFDKWRKWSLRDKPSEDFDVPEYFGIYGIYLLACFSESLTCKSFDPYKIPEEVIYIGMSSHVDRRLAQSHKAVRKYREDTGDDFCNNLWCVRAFSNWSNMWEDRHDIAKAHILFYERALILQYTKTYKSFPKYNNL